MDDREASEFYADPANLAIGGPGRKRKGRAPRLTGMTSVRFAPQVVEAVKDRAAGEGVTVGSWIRRLVDREIAEPGFAEFAVDGAGELVRVPADALDRVAAAIAPALLRHGALSLRFGQPSLLPRTFACAHMSVGNVASFECGTCGPLQPLGA